MELLDRYNYTGHQRISFKKSILQMRIFSYIIMTYIWLIKNIEIRFPGLSEALAREFRNDRTSIGGTAVTSPTLANKRIFSHFSLSTFVLQCRLLSVLGEYIV